MIVLAAASGFLGDLFELAGWLIMVLAFVGAPIAAAVCGGYRKLKSTVAG